MNTFFKFTMAALLITSTASFAENTPEKIEVVSSRYKNLFVLKAEKKFIGATVEILSSNGEVVTAQRLQKRKMIIDFCDVKYGAYTIRVTKDTKVKEFQYVKK